MNLADITTKCYILALIIRDDGERLLLGDGDYEFKDSQQHFIANTYANDVVELQGTDGQMLAGQVRRTATQTFAGYIGDATFSKQRIEAARRDFLMFFRKKHYYTAVYVFSDGTAIQRDRGYIVNAPSVPELYQRFPEWSVGLNFEDPNYYEYAEDDLGHEIAAHKVELELSTAMSGGLIWDGDGAVSDDLSYVGTEIPGEGKNFQLADTGTATLKSAELLGDAEQTTYSGKNLANINATPSTLNATSSVSGQTITVTTNSNATTGRVLLPLTYEANRQITVSFDAKMVQNDAGSGLISTVGLRTPDGSDTAGNVIISNTIGQTNHYRATVTLDNNTRWLWLYAKATSVAGVVKVEYSNIQIEYSSSETAYEPYVGGTASPNPDYPQAVNVVTGEQTVKIEGKNLFRLTASTRTDAGVAFTKTTDTITAVGTTTRGAYAESLSIYDNFSGLGNYPSYATTSATNSFQLPAGTYTFSANITNTGNTTGGLNIGVGTLGARVSTSTKLEKTAGQSGTASATVSVADGQYVLLSVWYEGNANAKDVNLSIDQVQLELGSTATAYEPYQGQEFEVNLGKNLLPISQSSPTATVANISATSNDDGTITLNGTGNANGWLEFIYALQNGTTQQTTPTIKLDASATYILSSTVLSGTITGTPFIAIQKNATSSTTNANIGESVSFTGSDGIYRGFIRVASGQVFNNAKIGIQVEAGSSTSSFAPYFTPIELAKIGDYQDRIYKSGGKWYIEKQIGKVVLDGSSDENWTVISSGTENFFYRFRYITGYDSQSDSSWLCNQATYRGTVTQSNTTIGGVITSTGEVRIRYGTEMALADWEAQLATTPIIFYYALATPTTTEITNSELVGQLERLQHAHTYADITNFGVTATSPNLPASLKVVAFGDDAIPQGGYVWEDGGTGGATIITVDGVDNAQPIWTVVGPATNPSLTNITTGESIQWTGVVPNGQTLVVNMADMTASLSGANAFEFISGSWITLQAGNNRVSYSATAATGIATLEWNGVVG